MRIALSIVLAFLALPALAEKLPLSAISAYLNDLETAEGDFTQVNSDGTISTGKILIKRPGRMRFEYDPPDDLTVVAGAGAVVILDGASNAPPETYPLRRTPLSLVLARNVDLARDSMVTGHDFDGTATSITAEDPENREAGQIRMIFTADPVELRQWVITDGNGIETTVILGALETDMNIPDTQFDTGRFTAGNNR